MAALLPAGLDRRFYAFVLDRLVAWTVYAAAVYAAVVLFGDDDRWLPGVALVVGTVVVVWLVGAFVLGLLGTSPGRAATGLRVVTEGTTAPIGVGPALLRTLVVGVATLPTFGFGAAALAWTALADPSGARRGWHDRLVRSAVVDVRPRREVAAPEPERPRPVVNLTAMRLVPASPTPPPTVPDRRPAAPPPGPTAPDGTPPAPATAPVPQVATPAATPANPPTVTPRRSLGWPLVGPPTPEPAAQAQPPAPAPYDDLETTTVRRPPAAWRVAFDTGEEFEVDGLTLVGRRPEPRPGEPARRLVRLPSPDLSLSKTHAQFQVVPDGALVVMDRGSTNGSFLLRGGTVRRLEPSAPATLRDGDVVRFGDREMRVSRAG
ncbi:RDD family protein [Nocardioides sp. SYSU D00038]|uniref:RDD family protein n=1 Tax=Nocardioides sp. SYSU D00038 TaxID=2812554 RepID=UPI00196809A9|nr:RDD family protein [Nocardioides sp. SYSU D00038]